MPTWTGFFTNQKSPALKVKIYGAWEQVAQEFDAIIDTGFTGFVSMPLTWAFPAALLLFGTTNVVLADGSTQFKLTAWGHVKVGDEAKTGVMILEATSRNILLGMEFLEIFGKTLHVSLANQSVELRDQEPSPPPAPTEATPEVPATPIDEPPQEN